MLVELGPVDQRYKAVCEMLDGASVTDVARRNGVARQTVQDWLRRYASRGGNVSFAGASYRAGQRFARQSIDVAVVGGSVQLSFQGDVIRVHPIRHDRAKEHGAYATPTAGPVGPRRREGQPCRSGTRAKVSSGYRYLTRVSGRHAGEASRRG